MHTLTEASISEQVAHVRHGFKEMQLAAQDVVVSRSQQDSLSFARTLFGSRVYQVRMVSVFIMGYIAYTSKEARAFLRQTVSRDPSWQVQEILAQAFNEYCRATGYENALPTITEWLADDNPNVKRAVTEGLRIWNRRDYFKQHPEIAISMLSQWKDHESEYLRKSVGNALRDISRTEKALIQRELASWDLHDKNTSLTYSLASKFLDK